MVIVKSKVEQENCIRYKCECVEYNFDFEIKDNNIYTYVNVTSEDTKVPRIRIWCSDKEYWPDEYYLEVLGQRIYENTYEDYIFYIQHGMQAILEIKKFFEELKI